MEIKKANTGLHVAQDAHEAKDCKINEAPHNHPDTDCGHYVDEGPGTIGSFDLNTYDNDHGKRSIVAGGPNHNLDQDIAHGPGIK